MLKRGIKKWDLVLLFINGIIGAGIFGLPSEVFRLSGFYSLPAIFLCAVIIFVLVFNFAEVSSRFDKTGGPYLYTLAAFGKIPAFIIGWLLLITRIFVYAALINLLVTYLSYFYPELLHQSYRFGLITTVTLILWWVNYLGIKSSTILSNILAVAKLLPLAIFIVVGLFFVNPELIDIKQPPPTLPDFSSTVLILVFAFTGFEAILVNTGEVQNPGRNLPFALTMSMVLIATFYIFIQFVSIGTLPELASSDKPITDAARLFMGPPGAILITLGAVISIGGTLNAVMLIGSRVPFALSEENQFPPLFSRLHSKYLTPVHSLLAFAGISLIASLTGSFIYSVSISVISKVLILLMVSAAMIKLRRKDTPDITFYKLRYGYFFAITGILASIWLLSSSKMAELRDVLITVAIGLVLFGAYKLISRKN